MSSIPLYYVWQYTDVDRAYWAEHFEGWLPHKILDAHTHVMDPKFRLAPMTEAMRRQYWVNEVLEPINADTAEQCMKTVFPNREVSAVVFGLPDLDFDLDAGNRSLQEECPKRGWFSLAVIRPQYTQEKVAALLDAPGLVGVKPYYSLISHNADTRDAHIEASIFDFLTHSHLELLNDRKAWVTLHVPKAARLGHPDNLREIREIRNRYPRITLVIAHLGRCYTEAHALEALPCLAGDPGLYFDTSAVLNPVCHEIAIKHLGPSQILYGSDNPILVDIGFDTEKRNLGELTAFINPEILWSSSEIVYGREGCFSVDSRILGIVPRAQSIKIRALDRQGNPIVAEYSGFTARIFQHELDHLNGIRFPDRVGPEGKLHWVDPGRYLEYRNNPDNWECLCPWETWLAMKEGKPFSPPPQTETGSETRS